MVPRCLSPSLLGGAGGLSSAHSPALPDGAEPDALLLRAAPGVPGFGAAQTRHPLLQL